MQCNISRDTEVLVCFFVLLCKSSNVSDSKRVSCPALNHAPNAKKTPVYFYHLISLEYMRAFSTWPFLWYGLCSGQTLLNRSKEKRSDSNGSFIHKGLECKRRSRFWIEWAVHWWLLALPLSFSPPNHLFSRLSFPDYQGPEALYHRGWDVTDWFVHPHMLADRGSPEANCGRVQLGGECSCLLLMLYAAIKQKSIFQS